MDARIEAFDIRKSLGGRLVLEGVRFSVGAGRIACLLGPNGSGKTTLLKTLSTLVLPDSGSARVAGLDLVRDAAGVRARIGVDFGEERSLYGRLTTRENLRFFAAFYGVAGGAFRTRLDELTPKLGLAGFLDRPCRELSTGMAARVRLARALLHDPPVLLLDEPTSGLDPVGAEEILLGLIRPLAADGRAVLLATHRLEEAERIADEVLVLAAGRTEPLGGRPTAERMLARLKELGSHP